MAAPSSTGAFHDIQICPADRGAAARLARACPCRCRLPDEDRGDAGARCFAGGLEGGCGQAADGASGLAVYDGPPEELAQLIYDNEKETDKTWTVSWDLPKNPRGYWITCEYANTTVTLTRKLPDTVTRCEVVHDRNVSFGGGKLVVQSMDCEPAE
jgi:hypothetical protein